MLRFWTRSTTPALWSAAAARHWNINIIMTPFFSSSHNNNMALTSMTTRGMAKSILKTNKSAAKRFRVRGNGQIARSKSGRSHNTGYKSPKRKSGLRNSTTIKGKGIEKRMRQMIGA
mmetsp:Transcript_6301/g.11475  ORF Transcript_6301/g.11475 Transcript_6301/m.11475 type:complete len:117 (+) Transcript_6301:103-453(+)